MMELGNFCFLTDQYYIDFPDKMLMQNKEKIGGVSHNRPCFFVLKDAEDERIFWLIPISSKYDKYKAIHDSKVEKYHRCDTIALGDVMGYPRAFLIQNMCPATEKYIAEIYFDKNNNIPVQIEGFIKESIIAKAKLVLGKSRTGVKLIFPDVKAIRAALLQQLAKESAINSPPQK